MAERCSSRRRPPNGGEQRISQSQRRTICCPTSFSGEHIGRPQRRDGYDVRRPDRFPCLSRYQCGCTLDMWWHSRVYTEMRRQPATTVGASGTSKFTLTPVTQGATLNVSKGRWERCVRAAQAVCPTGTFTSTCKGGVSEGAGFKFVLSQNKA